MKARIPADGLIDFLLIIAVTALLFLVFLIVGGCAPIPLTHPELLPDHRPYPKAVVTRKQGAEGYGLYDGKGNRRYDCELPEARCKHI